LLQKSFWGGERKFLEPLMRLTRGDVRDHIVSPKMASKSDAAAEKSKDQLSRDFEGCSIFDFCNNIGTNRTSSDVRHSVAIGGRPDMAQTAQFGRE
jgi:hypothetical protein